ncbi:HAD-IC family P-type ATPase, partial [Candidatus Similichlamydia laticola]|uniref:HAD-IC family P-type ATPase n=1 Tax=Candidatus Similichlamydia laticola TaxID=2170265 RepID=UPI0015F0B2B6
MVWEKHFSTALSLLLSALFLLSFLPQTADYLLPILYCACGTPALLSSIQELQERSFSIDALMSLAGFLAPLIGRVREGSFLLLLFFLSKELEKKIIYKATDSVRLAQLHTPQRVWESKEGKLHPVHIRDAYVDMQIAVHAGEMIPLDGIVLSGRSEVTTTQLNGELNPIHRGPGDPVYSGSYNKQALLLIRVTKKATDSTLERLIHLITEAKSEIPSSHLLLTRYQNQYALGVLVLCFLSFLALPYLLSSCSFLGPGGSFERSLTLLIALSPCALLIAVPSCYLSSISCCTRRGIVVKGTKHLELLPFINTVAFDKTGTLTEPCLHLQSFVCWTSQGEKAEPPLKALQALVQLEEQSLHPIGQSILLALSKRVEQAPSLSFEKIEQLPGQGVTASLDGFSLCIGEWHLVAQ